MARAEVFAALGDETRLELVDRLAARGPLPTLILVEGLDMSRQAASRHLDVLEKSGLVSSVRSGREVIRSLNVDELNSAKSWIENRATVWERKLAKLKSLVE